MESPRKFNDCYFYYYSTCIKGDECDFRHEPSALGCETMCTAWQQGKCLDKRCKLRHMELRKNRKQIPCYWENQPGGCRKIHCPFMHKNPDARTDGIAPSQPGHSALSKLLSVQESGPVDQSLSNSVGSVVAPPPVATPVPAPVPLLWQQQSQVVLDSAILGVQLSAGGELRRVLTPHPHPHPHQAPNPYASLPVDPLVVNFDEESDNESAPSSTPTKVSSEEMQTIARTKSQELFLLEKIQAEAAAFYSYDCLPSAEPLKERKIVRTNLNSKYDRLSLEDMSGKKQVSTERRNSLDFKVLSLDEIRARKKDAIIHNTPITLNLSRKRKLSTHETITTSGNKIIKVVRSNSIVYKKVDHSAPSATSQSRVDTKPVENVDSRKRKISELSDTYEIQEDELIDNCYEFKRVKIGEQTAKPRLIRNRLSSNNTSSEELKEAVYSKADDSDSEVQIVSVEISEKHIDLSTDVEVIDVESTKLGESIDVVDLSEDLEESDVAVSDLDIDLAKNVPDVVASCHKSSKIDNSDKTLNSTILNDIDVLLNDEL